MANKDTKLFGYRIEKYEDDIVGKCYKILKDKTGETVKKACDSPILRSIESARRYVRKNLPKIRTTSKTIVRDIVYIYGMEPDGSWIWDFIRNTSRQKARETAEKEWGWHDVHIAKNSDGLFCAYYFCGLTDPADLTDLESSEEVAYEAV